MTESDISIGVEGQVAILTLGRPHCVDIVGKRLVTHMLHDLGRSSTELRAVLLQATDPRAWLVDVRELADMPPSEARSFSHHGHELARAIGELPVPVIAAVDAPALGGGCELVLACDLALAGTNAQFGQIEAMGGVMPAFGGSWRLEERVGYQRAMAMMFTGEVIDAVTAKSFGIVLDVHPSATLLDAARELARKISACSMQSVAAIKRVTRAGRGLPALAKDLLEEEAFPMLFGKEQQDRMHAFLERQIKG